MLYSVRSHHIYFHVLPQEKIIALTKPKKFKLISSYVGCNGLVMELDEPACLSWQHCQLVASTGCPQDLRPFDFARTSLRIHTLLYMRVYIHEYVFDVCRYMCMYIYTHIYMYTYVHTYIHTHSCLFTCRYVHKSTSGNLMVCRPALQLGSMGSIVAGRLSRILSLHPFRGGLRPSELLSNFW